MRRLSPRLRCVAPARKAPCSQVTQIVFGAEKGWVESHVTRQEAASFLRRKPKTNNGGKKKNS